MECGQFVGKVKPETWWENPWDFQKFATKGGAAWERRLMELRISVIRFGGGNHGFFFENFRGGICFFLGVTNTA